MSVGGRLGLAAAMVAVVVVPASPAQADSDLPEVGLCYDGQAAVALIDPEAFDAAGLSMTIDGVRGLRRLRSVEVRGGPKHRRGAADVLPGVRPGLQPDVVKQIRCKGRTGESLDQGAWPDGSDNNSPGFERPPFFGFGEVADGVSGGRGTCEPVNQQIIDDVWESLTPAEQASAKYSPEDGTLVTVPDEEAVFGPVWTSPFEPTEVVGDTLQVRSKSLYAPTTDTSGIGARFLGAHYCTFVGPQYLLGLLEVSAASPSPSPTPSASASPSPTPSATATSSPTTTPASDVSPVASDTGAAELANTGSSDTLRTVLVGLIAVQIGLIVAVRSRREALGTFPIRQRGSFPETCQVASGHRGVPPSGMPFRRE